MESFQDKVAVVTGAGGGLGRAVSILFAAHGATVAAVDLNLEEARRTVELIAGGGQGCRAYQADMTSDSEVRALSEQVISEYGRVDILMNCVGIGTGGRFVQFSVDDWRKIIDLNLLSSILPMHYFLPHMIKRREGHVATVSSAGGLLGFANVSPYCATKFALVGLGESLRSELAGYGIGVSTICPTAMRTSFIEHSLTKVESKRDSRIQDVVRLMWKASYSPDKAAARVLKGIRKNKPLVIIGMGIQFGYFVKRLFPRLYFRVIETSGRLAAKGSG